MRVQINKYQSVPHHLDDEMEAYNIKWKPFLRDIYTTEERYHWMKNFIYYSAGICSCCKTELYGIWYTYTDGDSYNPRCPKDMKDERTSIFRKMYPDYDGVSDEQDAFEKSSSKFRCPICNAGHLSNAVELERFKYPLHHELTDGEIHNLLNPMFKTIHNKVSKAEKAAAKENAEEKAKRFQRKCDLPIPVQPSRKINDSETLKEYIRNLVQLETNIMSLNNRLTSLYYEHDLNKQKVALVDIQPQIALQKQIRKDQQIYDESRVAYENCQQQFDAKKLNTPQPVQISEPNKPVEPEYKKPTIFNKKKVLEENARLEEQFHQDMLDYERKRTAWLAETEKQNQALQDQYHRELCDLETQTQQAKEKMNALRVYPERYTPDAPLEACPEKAVQKMLESEIEQTENLLQNIYKARNEMYAANIVFGKYRDIVALATIYEYLESGRCTVLDGPTGAYNLYESEIRANLIIHKLSEIENSLSKIERSQYMICSKLTEMNSTLKSIDKTMQSAYSAISTIEANTNSMKTYMENISKIRDVIAHNTEVTAYYSKVNAELTNALGFMVALK